ncbi:uncharacterized protein LOC103832780 isoform X1 [Brassica rapa]|nr:uncharacterized protein LOC103832780 isoform X1 [Brassica rapa]XP_009107115.1 uncharacterized protein LOC103832780 isoform X1 [Brassica rapa]XP_009107116.1 uncharacterized protein LOC103832780 isoform X1 [Brassica rapa]
MLGSTVSRGSSSYGTEYCFISLPLAVNFKTRDWIRVIIGVEARKGMLEIMCDFTGTCAINYMYIQQQPQPQTTYNLSNASICAFVLTVCVSFNKAFYRILINGNTLSISKFCFWMVRRYKNRDNWQYQPVDQARPEDWSVQFEVRERQIERYITLNIVCSWVTNGLSLKLKDDLLKLKNPSLESVKTESKYGAYKIYEAKPIFFKESFHLSWVHVILNRYFSKISLSLIL